jgi:hypothetical protein
MKGQLRWFGDGATNQQRALEAWGCPAMGHAGPVVEARALGAVPRAEPLPIPFGQPLDPGRSPSLCPEVAAST